MPRPPPCRAAGTGTLGGMPHMPGGDPPWQRLEIALANPNPKINVETTRPPVCPTPLSSATATDQRPHRKEHLTWM